MCPSWDMVTGISLAAALRWKLFKEKSTISPTEVWAITSSCVHNGPWAHIHMSNCYPSAGLHWQNIPPKLKYLSVRSRHCSLASASYPSPHWYFYLSNTTFNIQGWCFSVVTLVICDHTDCFVYVKLLSQIISFILSFQCFLLFLYASRTLH